MSLSREALNKGISVEALIEVKKKEILNEQDLVHKRQLASDQIRMGLIAKYLAEHQQIAEVQALIDATVREIHRIKSGDDPDEVKEELIAVRRKTLKTLEADKDGREQRLLQAYKQKDASRSDEDSDLRGDPGPTVGADSERVPPGLSVFFDEDFEAEMWGRDLNDYLTNILSI